MIKSLDSVAMSGSNSVFNNGMMLQMKVTNGAHHQKLGSRRSDLAWQWLPPLGTSCVGDSEVRNRVPRDVQGFRGLAANGRLR